MSSLAVSFIMFALNGVVLLLIAYLKISLSKAIGDSETASGDQLVGLEKGFTEKLTEVEARIIKTIEDSHMRTESINLLFKTYDIQLESLKSVFEAKIENMRNEYERRIEKLENL